MQQSSLDDALVQQITRQVLARLSQAPPTSSAPVDSGRKQVIANISVRHIHLCREHMEILCGPGYELQPRNYLMQKGEYASTLALTLVGPRMRCLGEVRVLGPLRKATQVEISRTDAIFLGVDPPVRPSGNHEGSIGLILVGPVGVVHLQKGVILANRHIHLSAASAQKWGFRDNQIVQVRVKTPHKSTLLEDVQLRVSEMFLDEMHIDTDDGNAAGLRGGEPVEIVS